MGVTPLLDTSACFRAADLCGCFGLCSRRLLDLGKHGRDSNGLLFREAHGRQLCHYFRGDHLNRYSSALLVDNWYFPALICPAFPAKQALSGPALCTTDFSVENLTSLALLIERRSPR